eukprot:gene324-586_t
MLSNQLNRGLKYCSLLFIVTLLSASCRSVHISVQSNWPRYTVSSIAEVAEFIAEISPSGFWKYVDYACASKAKIDSAIEVASSESTFEIQSLALETATSIVPKSLHSLMETSLATGYYTPTLQFFEELSYPLGDPCYGKSFLIISSISTPICSYDEMITILQQKSTSNTHITEDFSWDHIYPASENALTPQVEVILYGSLGSSSFCSFHSQLTDASQQGMLKYIFRHATPGMTPVSNTTALQGYGVFLDIKNMEYKNVDDSDNQNTKDDDSSKVIFPPDEETEGLIFSKLLEKKPHLVEELKLLKSELEVKSSDDSSGGDMKVWRLKDLGLQALQSIKTAQFGVDDLSNRVGAGSVFCNARHDEAEVLLSGSGSSSSGTGTGCGSGGSSGFVCSALAVRKFLRRGRVALGLPSTLSAGEVSTYQTLQKNCDVLDLLTDELYVMDEELRSVALCFSRDPWILENCDYQIHRPLIGPSYTFETDNNSNISTCTSTRSDNGNVYCACPPCGVQPFLGLSSYFAPLCYVYRDHSSLYSVAKLMYCRLWSRLNVISSDSGTLVHVCKTFESLLASVHMSLYLHLLSLGIVLPWIQLGFVGVLEVDQILLLWDRVIGYMDTTLLATVAAAIFVFRADPLLQCTNAAAATSLLEEDSRLQIIPLLQMFFFSDEKGDTFEEHSETSIGTSKRI